MFKTLTIKISLTQHKAAMTATVNLGAAADFALLATTSITNTGTCQVSGSVGVTTGGTISGLPSTIVPVAFAMADSAHTDLQAACTEIQSRSGGSPVAGDLGGSILGPGLYCSPGAVTMSTTVTLSGAGVYVFQFGAALAVAAATGVVLTNGASSDQVFWQVTGACSLGAGALIEGSILGSAAIGLGAGSTVHGRCLTVAGTLTLDTSVVQCKSAAQLAAQEQTLILNTLTNTQQFQVELPNGELVSCTHAFGESLSCVVARIIANTSALCDTDSILWQLKAENGGAVVTAETLPVLAAAGTLLLLRPECAGQPRLDAVTTPEHCVVLHFQTEFEEHTNMRMDKRYSVRFYQREFSRWWGMPRQQHQVWIDDTNQFIAPTTLLGVFQDGARIRIALCQADQLLRAQLS